VLAIVAFLIAHTDLWKMLEGSQQTYVFIQAESLVSLKQN